MSKSDDDATVELSDHPIFNRHTQIPNELIDHQAALGLRNPVFILIIHLLRYRYKATRLPYPSMNTLRKKMGLKTLDSIKDSTHWLEEKKYLVRQYDRTKNRYTWDLSGLFEAALKLPQYEPDRGGREKPPPPDDEGGGKNHPLGVGKTTPPGGEKNTPPVRKIGVTKNTSNDLHLSSPETDKQTTPPLSPEEELKRIARMKAHLKATQPQEEEKNESS